MTLSSLFVALFLFSATTDAATTGVGGVATTTAIAAYGNMMAIGDGTITTTAQAKGHVGVTYFDFRTNDWTGREAVLLNPYVLDTGSNKVTYGDANTNVDANNGFGNEVTCANDNTIFISACTKDFNSGRVYLYKGRNAHWTSQQILNSYYTGPSESYSTSSDTFFGEAMDSSEGVLAVGCRNCNSTVKGYAQSGEVYVFRPERKKDSLLWTNTQVLTGKDIYFMGGHVAMHQNVIVASGNSKEEFTLNTIQTTPIMASIFYAEDYLAPDGPRSEFKYQQNIFTRDPVYQRVADVAVYDMTVTMATYDTVRDTNHIYVFYPNTKKYNLQSKDAKGKPRPLSWSLVQVLATPDPVVDFNYQFPTHLTMFDNKLFMRGKTATADFTLNTNRTTRAGSYHVFYQKDNVPTQSLNHMMIATDFKLYQDGLAAGRVLNTVLDLTPDSFNCLRIWVEDEFDDGWDVAELIVESPSGVRRSYKTDCDSVNPLVHRYCPLFNDEVDSKGIHKLYIINGHEAKFNWEILWRVYDEATAKWYLGDVHTEMDFEWQYRDHKFLNTRVHQLRHNLTCSVCPQNEAEWNAHKSKPKPKAQALQNLRALHHRPDTSTPTMSPAPTIAVDVSTDWNVIEMINDAGGGVTEAWFNGEGRGTFFYISDTEGKKLVYSGSACTAGNVAVECYVKLDDGDYVLRVSGANDVHTLERRWKFCQGLNYQASQTELYFSIVDGVCFPVMTRHQTLVCDNILKVTNLNVEISLSGDFSGLVSGDSVTGRQFSVTHNQLQPVADAVSTALQQLLGFEAFSSSIANIKSSSTHMIVVVVDVGLKKLDESMYARLEMLELGGGMSYRTAIANQVLSAPASLRYDTSVIDALTDVGIIGITVGSETVDHVSQDESNYYMVTDFIPYSSSIHSPKGEALVKVEHIIAVAGYMITIATVFVAVGFVYTNIKARVGPSTIEKSPIKPSIALANLHRANLSDDDDSGEETNENEISSARRKLSIKSSHLSPHTPKHKKSRSIDEDTMRKWLENEDAVYRKGNKLTSAEKM